MIVDVPTALVFAFFESFARFECAMKEAGFCKRASQNRAEPDWPRLSAQLGAHLAAARSNDLDRAMSYLLANPPEIQMYRDGRPEFAPAALRGANDGERVFDALKRVRNNLFHGGKHTNHSPEERDKTLLSHALTVLEAAADLDLTLRSVYRSEY